MPPEHPTAESTDRPTERESFALTFDELGPHAPTILPGWDADDLLEHLQLREGAAHLVAGRAVPGPWRPAVLRAIERDRTAPWSERVERFRAGPGRWSPAGRIDALTGQGELLIHHEDLRRAQDGWHPPRLSPERAADAWRAVGLMAPLAMRVRADITLVSPMGGRRLRSRGAAGALRVHGEPLELLLWISGRDEVARVRIHGDEAARHALAEGRRGL